jgi:tryptophan synthase alpha chain
MNRIDQLFQKKKNNILSVYFTAGFPTLNNTVEIISELEKSGADLVEIGMPFSDPLADGPVIQQSSQKALGNGMSIRLLFEQLAEIRKEITIPLILMGYLNPVLQYGMENFLKKAKETGIDGLILPDLPLKEYLQLYREMFETAGIHNIMLISPQTSEDRVKLIDQHSGGFVYMVSSASTTGSSKNIFDIHNNYFQKISALNLEKPRLIGFGISNRENFRLACENANGAIIGSAFIRAISEEGELTANIKSFMSKIL